MLLDLGGYMAERVGDLDDVRDRTVARLLGEPIPGVPERDTPYVLVADDLAPADTVTLTPEQVLALVTVRGGPTSHTAILARSLGIPAVVACPAAATLREGELVAVDGASGQVRVGVSPEEAAEMNRQEGLRRAARAASRGPGRTADGHAVALLLNIGDAAGAASVAEVDAEGVGLFRTEFLYLDRQDAPSVDEQVAMYTSVFEAMGGRKIVVRTLDAGADKPLPFLNPDAEPNPALGMRGLRTARRSPDVLTDQLTALARAQQATSAVVWVMAPMVATAAEAKWFTDLAREQGLTIAGAMVEIPAAAMRAADLLEHADFLSIGTNDLAQYTLAADRMAGELADLLDPWQPALLDLIRMTAEAGAGGGQVGRRLRRGRRLADVGAGPRRARRDEPVDVGIGHRGRPGCARRGHARRMPRDGRRGPGRTKRDLTCSARVTARHPAVAGTGHQATICPEPRARNTGEWPSGKAPDSGSGDRRFESFLPSQTPADTLPHQAVG